MTFEIIIEDIRIEVVKKKIKNLRLSVHPPDGRVRIAAPYNLSDDAIHIFALSKIAWIKKHQAKCQLPDWQISNKYVTGECHFYNGQRYLLNVVYTSKKQRVELKANNQIDLYVGEGSSVEQRKKVMMEWYRSELKKKIPDLIVTWEKQMGVRVNSWGVKQMKTRWGTCNPSARRIWINLELAKKDHKCLEYVIVHEMVHLLERNHGRKFYEYMDLFLPDWRWIRSKLNTTELELDGVNPAFE